MRTLVFGGSFDPPHRGHAALLAAAAERVRPDRILIVPAFQAPLKGAPSASAAERLALARLGVRDALPVRWRRLARVDGREARARRRVYTVETLRALRVKDPGGELHFLCGRDAAACFGRWRKPELLRRLATWWCGGRPGAGRAPAFFRRVPGHFPGVSSTALRSALALGKDVSGDLAPAVLARVRERGLYGLDLLKRLEKTLNPHRFAHTLSVAALAEDLARRHDENPDKARLAGLLHDLGRGMRASDMPGYCRRRRLKIPEMARIVAENPLLLHAYVSEDLARRELGVADPAVLSAVRAHTFGAARMSRLDRLLYTADACEPGRAHAGATAARRLASRDLDAAFARCVAAKLRHARGRGGWIHPVTVKLWNSLAAR
ncbi:MAG: bis(5'-nucleosyl)-tetraphosphatase (symmetrical) YqeK [Elusimicrobia bacterium]|nr:bis(5'-nucleosyl)-tetraphosphatase (symmetrical) YqeK [Elusimicrobiota bacterium]